MKENQTRVGKMLVELRDYQFPTVVEFSAGVHGRKERGAFAFWTAVFRKPVMSGKRKLWGRSRLVLPAGDRFDRMQIEMRTSKDKEDRKIYGSWWKAMGAGKNIAYIRPSTHSEVRRWIDTHLSDAKFITSIRCVNG